MLRTIVLPIAAAVLCAATLAASPSSAASFTRKFAVTYVRGGTPDGASGYDAGIDVRHGAFVRITASGGITQTAFGACGHQIGPDGCRAAFSFARSAPNAPAGALVAAFVDAAGRPVTSWAPVGTGAFVAVPANAERLILRLNGMGREVRGAVHVVADVVASPSTGTTAGVRRPLAETRAVAAGTQMTRRDAQYVLRRFGYSDTPANVTAALAEGIPAWIAAQLNPSAINDTALSAYLAPIPNITGNPTIDSAVPDILQYRITQRQVASQRQLLEKVTEHWLDHFAVGNGKVNDPYAMAHYEETVRADALGNFATLVSDVATEPAMLLWLDNNYNTGTDPTNPPNENFGRELMQLYTIGIAQLNLDGTTINDSNGNPLPAYGEPDVKQVALALTGFSTNLPYPLPVGQPADELDQEQFNPGAHGKGPYTIIGQSVADPGDATVINDVIGVLAHNASVAPFESKELIQRFVTETPSTGYVSRVATVWQSTENDPQQIAKVVNAIVSDPEFYNAVDAELKTPVEFSVDAIRAIGGEQANLATNNGGQPMQIVDQSELGMAMELWNAPTVFSFYRPGDKESLLTNYYLLQRWQTAANIAYNAQTGSLNTSSSLNLNIASIAKDTPAQQAAYLLDALVDGGDPELQSLVVNYLTGTKNLQGAIWIVLASPNYEVD